MDDIPFESNRPQFESNPPQFDKSLPHGYRALLPEGSLEDHLLPKIRISLPATSQQAAVVHLPSLGDEEDPVPLHRGVWGVRELQVVLAHLRRQMSRRERQPQYSFQTDAPIDVLDRGTFKML